jgi:hypothetical protein
MNKINDIIKKWLTDNYGNLERYETDEYPNYTFFTKDGKVILDYNQKNGYCSVNYEEIWSFLSSVFQLEYEEIQSITKEWVEEHYKLRVTTTELDCWINFPWWRNITNYHIED